VGLVDLLASIAESWENDRQSLLNLAETSTNYLMEHFRSSEQKEAMNQVLLDEGYIALLDSFDDLNGGFGTAPKFPSPHNLMFLLRYYNMKHTNQSLDMVEKTLQKMRLGGIYDHLGFGFHRYSTDSSWTVPHFEKMLYDQAMTCMAYTEAYQVTRKEDYKKTAEEILQYVLAEMTDPEGGFYSAEDADTEGQEGRFYLWTKAEIENALGNDTELICKIFNISKNDGKNQPSNNNRARASILHLKGPLDQLASEMRVDPEILKSTVSKSLKMLYKKRQERARPFKDTKILTDWNGLMIAALAKCAQAFKLDEYAKVVGKASNLILETLRTRKGALMHRYKDDEVTVEGMIDDYAFFIWGLIETYEVTFKVDYLKAAVELQDMMIEQLWDESDAAFFFAPKRGEQLLVRNQEFNDGAIPSGNSVAVFNLIRLARLTGKTDYEEKARALAATVSLNARYDNTMFLTAASFLIGPTYEIVVVGNPQSLETHNMLQTVNSKFSPNKVVIFKPTNDKTLENLAPYTKFMTTTDSKTTAYVCRDFRCNLPLTEAARVLEALDNA